MLIANPIYDAVFKYLLEDRDIARRFLSAIIGEEIIELEVKPQEQTTYSDHFLIKVFRLDFKAVIQLQTGEFKTILIELQKGKQLIDIMRFRRYLGENYQNKETTGKAEQPLPIVTIYFLGFELPNVPVPIIKVNRVYTDVTTNETLQVKDEFIEKLTHDCFVIQIPRLTLKHQSRIEKVVSIFNQTFIMDDRYRLLDFPTTDMDDELVEKMAKRLNKAKEEADIRRQITVQEDFENALEDKLREKDVALEEKEKELGAYKQVVVEYKQAVGEYKQALEDKDKILEEYKKTIDELLKNNKS